MKQTSDKTKQDPAQKRELARRVAERVWALWQETLRHENERRGGGRR